MNDPKPNAYLPLITQPDLYRRNGFRLAELPVEAGGADLSKRRQMIALSQATGLAIPPGSGRALPLLEAMDTQVLNDAIQALHDPEQRLLSELFWFWPLEAGQSRDDRALQALAQGQIAEAIAIWQSQQQQDGITNIPLHNLAVLTHALALDLEHLAARQPLTRQQRADLAQYWEQALQLWGALMREDSFWGKLAQRAAGLADPRLTPAAVAHIRRTLPTAVLSINAQLAVSAARAGDLAEAKRQVARINGSGYEATAIEQALRQAAAPLCQQINAQAAAAESEADSEPERGDEVTRRLIAQSQPLLGIVDALLPWGHTSRTNAHDEVAQRALGCLIPFGNRTERWKVVLGLLADVDALAEGNALKARIAQNIQTVEGNLLHDTCWFCGEEPGVEGAGISHKLYGNVRRTPFLSGYRYGERLEWNTRTVTVPRCRECRSAHNAANTYGTLSAAWGGIVALLVWLVLVFVYPAASLSAAFLSGVGVWILVYAYLSTVATPALRTIRPKGQATAFPPLRELLNQGWQFGEKPPEAN